MAVNNKNNSSLTVQQKEQLIVGTILYCNNVIKHLNENFHKSSTLNKLFETDIIHFNMVNLASKITGDGIVALNENVDSFVNENNFIPMNEHQNHYAYFKKVRGFLNGFETEVQKSLNESLFIKPNYIRPLGGGSVQTETAQQEISNIETFKQQLNKYISELEKNNDTDNYTDQVLKIKVLANKPMYVYGFNIAGSLLFQKEICTSFNKNSSDLLTILFEKSDKYLMFVFKNDIITYSISDDNLKRMPIEFKFDERNYMLMIGENISRNTTTLYQNVSDLRYTNNLYNDEKQQNFIASMTKSIIR